MENLNLTEFAKSTKCTKLINIAIELKEQGKARIEISKNKFGDDVIGIQLENTWCFYWFSLDNELNHVMFDHRYSQASGRITKGFSTGYNFLNKIGFYQS